MNKKDKIEADYDIEASSQESQQMSFILKESLKWEMIASENELDYFPKIGIFKQN